MSSRLYLGIISFRWASCIVFRTESTTSDETWKSRRLGLACCCCCCSKHQPTSRWPRCCWFVRWCRAAGGGDGRKWRGGRGWGWVREGGRKWKRHRTSIMAVLDARRGRQRASNATVSRIHVIVITINGGNHNSCVRVGGDGAWGETREQCMGRSRYLLVVVVTLLHPTSFRWWRWRNRRVGEMWRRVGDHLVAIESCWISFKSKQSKFLS